MIFESNLPRIEIPNMNVADYVLSECERLSSADHRVFVDSATNEFVTVDQLIIYTRRFATSLRSKCGICAGDVVATFANNSIYYPFVAYGIVAAGAICTPANASYTPQELAHQLSNSRCRVIIVGDGLRDTVEQALQLADHKVSHILMLDESRAGCKGSIFQLMSTMEDTTEIEDNPFSSGQPENFAVAPAYLCYSSGTTGKPKGVVLTHRNMIANAMQINQLKKLDMETMNCQGYETYLGLAPFCHAYGLSYVLHSSVSLGGRIVVMRRYTFENFLKAVQEYRITFGYLVPPIVCALSKDPRVDSYDLSSMHTILSGGAALSPTLIETTELRIPGVRVIQGYGMSEMSPAMTMLSTRHRNLPSIGILLSNCQAKVIDDQGIELGVCKPGELCFKGPNVMPEYLDNPAATRDIFDNAGFLHTGDIGYIDEAGFFYITDRKKEIIKFKGFQVAPSELEGLLAEHPDIEDAAVMAVYDDNQATEIPKGYFVLKKQSNDSDVVDDIARGQAVVDWLHERVAKFKRLRGGFSIIENIPRSPAGKIIRNSLRDMDHISSRDTSGTPA